jgi:hypothetical protein
MRCRKVRELVIEEGAGSARTDERWRACEEHLRACARCTAYVRHWKGLQEGLRRLGEEQAPLPSLGFAVRLARSLGEVSGSECAQELFLARAGRRFVYGALTAVLLLVLGLLVPPSGPLRSASAASLEPAQPEVVAAQNYPLFSGQLLANDFEFAPPSSGH